MIISSVLVVEDERIIAMHMRALLSRLGYQVVGTASTGEEAVELANDLQPDLVLMDIRLEGSSMDGIAAAEHIRTSREVPVIYVSAYANDPAITTRASPDPTTCLLPKPVDPGRLKAAIDGLSKQ